MPFKAIAFRALVKPDSVEKMSAGGIALAIDETLENAKQVIGTIIELGEDFAAAFKPKTPFWGLKPGDKVVYATYSGKGLKDPRTGEAIIMINDEDILGLYVE